MNRIILFFTLSLVVAFHSSCTGNKSDSLFGDVPVVYEQQTQPLAKEIKAGSQQIGKTTAAEIIQEKAPAVFAEAKKIAKPLADELIGKHIGYSIDKDARIGIIGDIVINEVSLPQLTESKVISQIVKITFQVADSCKMDDVYYALTDGKDVIDVSYFLVHPNALEDNMMTIPVYAPNIPSDYLSKCTHIRFISEDTYDKLRGDVHTRQFVWRQEYAKKINE